MTTEPKSNLKPYYPKFGPFSTVRAVGPRIRKDEGDLEVRHLNIAYAEGFKAGRASRDGLREALK